MKLQPRLRARVEEPDSTSILFVVRGDVNDPELVEEAIYPRYLAYCRTWHRKAHGMTALGISYGPVPEKIRKPP